MRRYVCVAVVAVAACFGAACVPPPSGGGPTTTVLPPDLTEIEPNDTPQQATPLGSLSSEAATGQLASRSDEDVFSIHLSALTGLVTKVSGSLDGTCDPAKPAPDLQILRPDQTPVAYRTAAPDGCTVIAPAYELETGLLEPGRYYVRIVPSFVDGLTGLPAGGALRSAQLAALTEPASQLYSFVFTEADPLAEAEPNDELAQASPLGNGINRAAVGDLDPIGGADTYVLDFAGPPTSLFAQTYMPDKAVPCDSGPAMRIRLLNAAGDPVEAWPNNTGPCGYGTLPLDLVPLSAGRYYLQVTQEPGGTSDATGERYRLDVLAVAPTAGDQEVEPNDELTSPNVLYPSPFAGSTVAFARGQSTNADTDVFALEVPTATPLFAAPFPCSDPSALQIDILDSAGISIPRVANQCSPTEVLPAGQYFVKVSGEAADYSIAVGYRTYSDVVDTSSASYFELAARGGVFFYPYQPPRVLLVVRTPSRVRIDCLEQPDPTAGQASATISPIDGGEMTESIICGTEALSTTQALLPGEYILTSAMQGPSLRRLGFTIIEEVPPPAG